VILSVDQTVALLRHASLAMGISLSPEELRALTAIPARESHYDSNAMNLKGTDRSYGPWQINTLDAQTWRNLSSTLGLSNPEQLLDPYTSAKAVVLEVKWNRQAFGNGLWGWGPYKGVDPLTGVNSSAISAAEAAIGRAGISGAGTSYGPTSRVDPGGNRVSGGMPNEVDQAINWALTQQGKPYKFGGSADGSSYDCSSLTAAFLKQMGISAPALTWTQAKMGVHVDANNLRPGDLIFVHGAQGDLGHVKIYLGGGVTLEAPRTGDVVKIAPLNVSAIQEARRFVPDSIANSAQEGASPRGGGMSDTSVNTGASSDQNNNPSSALANASDDEVKAYVRAHYGTMAGFLDDPEVGPILMDAARNGTSPQSLIGQLQATNWWRLRDDAARAWAQGSIDNPGQQAAQIGQRVLDIQQAAGQLGVTMTSPQVQALAEESLRSGWSTEQLKHQIIGNIDWEGKGNTAGELQTTKQHMLDLGRQYFQNIDPAQAQRWAVAIADGTLTEDGVKTTLQSAAEGRWSFLKGVTPADFFAPIQGAIANELEMPSTSVDLMDKKWDSALERVNSDGTIRPTTITEARQVARSQPEWVKTDSAMSQLTAGAGSVMQTLTGSNPWG
jgi:hypothetical protein